MKNLLRNAAYASVIIASTAVTVHSLKMEAEASSLLSAGRIVATSSYHQSIALLDDGSLAYIDRVTWRTDLEPTPLPVPVSRVAFFGGSTFIDTDGNGWGWNDGWVNIGPPPPPVPTENSTWGAIKSRNVDK